jgi:predicted dehydrogenase
MLTRFLSHQFTVILHYAPNEARHTVLTATLRGHLLSLRKNQLRYTIRGSRGTFNKYGIDPQEEQMKEHGVDAFSLPDFGVESAEIWGTLEAMSSPPASSSSSTSGDENGSETKSTTSAGGLGSSSGTVVAMPIESERGRYQDLYTNLFASIREGAEPAIRWKEAELTMLITELAVQSSKEGRTVKVPAAADGNEKTVPSSPARDRVSISRKLGRTLLRGSFHRKVESSIT